LNLEPIGDRYFFSPTVVTVNPTNEQLGVTTVIIYTYIRITHFNLFMSILLTHGTSAINQHNDQGPIGRFTAKPPSFH
jgi:hypothetical protein